MSKSQVYSCAEGSKQVSWSALSPLQGLDSMTMTFQGKFAKHIYNYIYIYIYVIYIICNIYIYIYIHIYIYM